MPSQKSVGVLVVAHGGARQHRDRFGADHRGDRLLRGGRCAPPRRWFGGRIWRRLRLLPPKEPGCDEQRTPSHPHRHRAAPTGLWLQARPLAGRPVSDRADIRHRPTQPTPHPRPKRARHLPAPRPQRHHDPPRRRRILRRIAHPHDPARENRRRTRPGARPATAPRGGHPTAGRAEIPRALSAACRSVGRPLVGRLSRFSTPPRRDPDGHSPLPSGLRSAGPSRPRVGDQPPLIPGISPGGEIR